MHYSRVISSSLAKITMTHTSQILSDMEQYMNIFT